MKVFDFGLARQLPDIDPACGNTCGREVFHMTQMTGTLRFMAPEVALGQPYNQQCDVFSVALIVWEMLNCQRPYAKLKSESDFVRKVFHQHDRPKVPSRGHRRSWLVGTTDSEVIACCLDLLQGGWNAKLQNRWTIHQVQGALKTICSRLDRCLEEQQHKQQTKHDSKATKVKRSSPLMNAGTTVLCWPKWIISPKKKTQNESSTMREDDDSLLFDELQRARSARATTMSF